MSRPSGTTRYKRRTEVHGGYTEVLLTDRLGTNRAPLDFFTCPVSVCQEFGWRILLADSILAVVVSTGRTVTVEYLLIGSGIWLLYRAWRGTEHTNRSFGKKDWASRPMSRRTRVVFFFGGIALTSFGFFVLWIHQTTYT